MAVIIVLAMKNTSTTMLSTSGSLRGGLELRLTSYRSSERSLATWLFTRPGFIV